MKKRSDSFVNRNFELGESLDEKRNQKSAGKEGRSGKESSASQEEITKKIVLRRL